MPHERVTHGACLVIEEWTPTDRHATRIHFSAAGNLASRPPGGDRFLDGVCIRAVTWSSVYCDFEFLSRGSDGPSDRPERASGGKGS